MLSSAIAVNTAGFVGAATPAVFALGVAVAVRRGLKSTALRKSILLPLEGEV